MGFQQENSARNRSTTRPANIESQVDSLLDEMAKLGLFMKKKKGDARGAGASRQEQNLRERLCYYCREPGRGASRCPKNPHRNTVCPRCGKLEHSEATCWTKVKQ